MVPEGSDHPGQLPWEPHTCWPSQDWGERVDGCRGWLALSRPPTTALQLVSRGAFVGSEGRGQLFCRALRLQATRQPQDSSACGTRTHRL